MVWVLYCIYYSLVCVSLGLAQSPPSQRKKVFMVCDPQAFRFIFRLGLQWQWVSRKDIIIHYSRYLNKLYICNSIGFLWNDEEKKNNKINFSVEPFSYITIAIKHLFYQLKYFGLQFVHISDYWIYRYSPWVKGIVLFLIRYLPLWTGLSVMFCTIVLHLKVVFYIMNNRWCIYLKVKFP